MKRNILLLLFVFAPALLFAKKHRVDFKEHDSDVIEINFYDYSFYTNTEDFMVCKEAHNLYLPDSLMDIVKVHQSATDTLRLSNPENGQYFLDPLVYNLIFDSLLSKIVKQSSHEYIKQLEIKKTKVKCPNTLNFWVWKGFNVFVEKQVVFTFVTHRRLVNCGNAKF